MFELKNITGMISLAAAALSGISKTNIEIKNVNAVTIDREGRSRLPRL